MERFSGYDRYLLNHIKRKDGIRLAGKALLYQYRFGKNRMQLQTAHIQAGQSIRAQVRWHEPRNYHNPGAFDYRAWRFDHHIALIGSMKGYPEISNASVPWLEQQRQSVRRVIAEAGVHDGGVLQAVLLGERSQLTEQASHVFSATGAAYLLAISGMHIGMASAAYGTIAGWPLPAIRAATMLAAAALHSVWHRAANRSIPCLLHWL